jgi:hypothetical protein
MLAFSSSGLIRLSRIFAQLCLLGMIAIPCLLALVWWHLDWLAANSPELRVLPFNPAEIRPAQQGLGFAVSMIPASVLVWGLWRLREVFSGFATGVFFSARTVEGIRAFALAVTLQALLRPVATTLLSIVLTMHNPPGQRALVVAFGSRELESLFIGGIFLAVACVMAEGRRLAEDNAQFV